MRNDPASNQHQAMPYQPHNFISPHGQQGSSQPAGLNFYKNVRSASLPLKIMLDQQKSDQHQHSDKLIKSWNDSSSYLNKNKNKNRFYLYAHLSLSEHCLNLINHDLSSFLQFPIKDKKTVTADHTQPDVQFTLDQDPPALSPAQPEPENDLTLTQDTDTAPIDSASSTSLINSDSSGYNSIDEESTPELVPEALDETCRDIRVNDVLISSSSEDDLLIDFMPKKSCLKKLFIDTSDCSNDSANATSSPLCPVSPVSPSFSLSSSNCSSITVGSPTHKKRVSFADNKGKDLFTVRTMSEPSNCPPKLTSKIVEYFLNREFNTGSNSNLNGLLNRCNSNEFSISALNYTNDVKELSGSIAVYSLNFAQPAGDYLNFRRRLDDKFLSLENVLLNRFQINGTIKVKNINFHKQVFVRCSFDNWGTSEDFEAQYVPCEYFTSNGSMSSPPSSAFSSPSGQSLHKDYDTFRFEFQLPKTVKPSLDRTKETPNASIQFCICYRTGLGPDQSEHWDNNSGANYEILQYVIDIEKLKPTSTANKQPRSSHFSAKPKPSVFRYDSSFLLSAQTGIYY